MNWTLYTDLLFKKYSYCICQVLATGLSGLYSSLPRKIPVYTDEWHQFSQEDISLVPELQMFLNSLEFCNAVTQVCYCTVVFTVNLSDTCNKLKKTCGFLFMIAMCLLMKISSVKSRI